jgi:3',5'-nucleoside bisphosphate phosphatase
MLSLRPRVFGLHWNTRVSFSLIDLHSHTNESDGSCSPAQLVEEAVRAGVRVLGITDHDTFRGFDQAAPLARAAGIDPVC